MLDTHRVDDLCGSRHKHIPSDVIIHGMRATLERLLVAVAGDRDIFQDPRFVVIHKFWNFKIKIKISEFFNKTKPLLRLTRKRMVLRHNCI